jgi:hypothetical protein
MFLLFANYGIWFVVFHGMSAFKLRVGVGAFLPIFSLVV